MIIKLIALGLALLGTILLIYEPKPEIGIYGSIPLFQTWCKKHPIRKHQRIIAIVLYCIGSIVSILVQ